MNRRRGVIWLVAGLVLAVLAAGISYYFFQQMINQQQQFLPELGAKTQTVVVVRQPINERGVIRLADISTEERSIAEVPSGVVFKTEDAVGRLAKRPLPAGQVLLAQNLVESFPSGGSSFEASSTVTETVDFNEALGDTLIAFSLPAGDRLSREGILLPGDHVDLLFSTDVVGQQEGTGGKIAVYAIQDSEILQVIYQPPPPPPEGQEPSAEPPARIPKMIILAMNPQDATVLKYALDIQAPIDVALRAGDNRRQFEVESVSINTLADRYEFIAPRPLP